MIRIDKKQDCCGCAACYNICPQTCIIMANDEEGFLYPSFDADHCTDCGLCDLACPIINPVKEEIVPQRAFLVQHKNDKIRTQSTSGGAFTAIAEYVINQDGVVFGAAYNNHFEVMHRYVETIDDLKIFRNSKYVQSRIGNSFKQVKTFLKIGKLVCFSGTPCQVEGLNKFLQKEYKNLITVDVVCRAVPSPLVWKKYLGRQNINSDNIQNIVFRDKTFYGYKYSVFAVYDKFQTAIYHNGIETDVMLRAFFSNICDRPSCYDCRFKKRYRVSDLTLWDCFSVDEFSKQLDDDKGTTKALAHSGKARQILKNISNLATISEINADQATRSIKEMFESVSMNPKRTEFFQDLKRFPPEEVFNKYFPYSIKAKLEKQARLISYKLGVYQQMKKIVKIIFPNLANKKS